jgi:hypothetical protein
MTGLALNLYYESSRLMLPADVADFFRETLDECNRRGLDHVQVVPSHIREDDRSPTVHRGDLIRYDKRARLERLIQGIISFGPAHIYKEALIDAQRDDEMSRRSLCPNQVVTIGGVQYPASDIVFHSHIAKKDGTHIHYHLFCASYEESQKLRRAFRADGFVRIRDYTHFFTLLAVELKRSIPQAALLGGKMRYYDDREGHNSKTLEDIIFCKTIDYIYEREYRIAVLNTPQPTDRFEIRVSIPEGLLELELTNEA